MVSVSFTIVACFLVVATAFDLRTRQVPDWVSVVIAATGLTASFAGWLGVHPIWMVTGGLVGFAIGWVLFRFAHFGGADAKLIAALGCVVGSAGLLIVLFGMAIAGGVLSLVAITRGQRDYAYVPAILIGFLTYLGFLWWI